MRNDICVIILAVKKSVAFPDDLIKKLDGITLIQRAINQAKNLVEPEHIVCITDSQEITLIGERNGINVNYKDNLKLKSANILIDIRYFLLRIYKKYKNIFILYPYTPLLSTSTIKEGYTKYTTGGYDALITVKKEKHRLFNHENNNIKKLLFNDNQNSFLTEVKAFLIIKSDLVREKKESIKLMPYRLDDETIEIQNYQDWWICEKLLKRKRIVFRMIGNAKIGMGHIYRSLTLAHEITDHEIIFVCDNKSRFYVNTIADGDYLIYSFPEKEIEHRIIDLKPNLVINDILNTESNYISRLKRAGISVVNFEDLGSGAHLTDITFNELFDQPVIEGRNILWGSQYFFVREEFCDATPRVFKPRITNLLISFGGTDQHNLTMKILNAVIDICSENEIMINVVTGAGYEYKNELDDFISKQERVKINYTFATGIISKILEHTDLAISSNGRTVYELYHMNIPSLVVSQHERESTHSFSTEENGFLNLGCYSNGRTEKMVRDKLYQMIHDRSFRKKMFDRMKSYNFLNSKDKVLSLINGLIE